MIRLRIINKKWQIYIMSFILDCLDNNDDYDDIDNYFNEHEAINDEKKDNITNSDIIVGIDLGTTNSCIALWRNNNLEIISDIYGNKTIPSIIAFTKTTKYIGKEAKNQIELNPDNTIYEVKRLIGRTMDDQSVINDMPYITYKIDRSKDNNNIIIKTDMKVYTPEEISAILLLEMKQMAENYLKKSIKKVVITVPAYFNDAQRQATKDAAIIAGLECIRVINEPTAAALAYGFEKKTKIKDDDVNIIVYDLGGGTLDVSILNIANGVFEVLASTGNTHLGGTDFDNRLVKYCLNEFRMKNKIQNLDNLRSISFQKLRKACETAKRLLSVTWKTTIIVKDFYDDKNLFITITRNKFEMLCKDLFILCLKSVEDALNSCEMNREDIDDIILVGGSTRMPLIKENLRLFFNGKEPNDTINPDEVVAVGAAIQASLLANKNDPFSENVVLLDIIPLSLGLETIGGVMEIIIPRNSIMPTKIKKKFTTDSDNETSVKIRIFEGERKMTKDNFLVGEFILSGLEKAPRGIAEIEITFNVDVNGIVTVIAEDLKNNENKKSLTITGNKGRLSAERIQELIMEAEEMELKDKVEREKKQLFYEIDDLCSNVKTNIKNEEYKLKETDKKIIMEDIDKVLGWLKEKDYFSRDKRDYFRVLDRIKRKYSTLILKIKEDNNVKASTNNYNATSIYDDEENESIYQQLENEEYGITDDMDENIKNELKNLRTILTDLCYNVLDVLSNNFIKIDNDYKQDLKDQIDDILLWLHVKEKITKMDYDLKIKEVNDLCNNLMVKNDKDLFEDNLIVKNIVTKRDELEQLCYALLSSISTNIFSIHEKNMNELSDKINDTLNWLISVDVDRKKEELQNNEYNMDELVFQKKIDEINKLCDYIYNNMVNINTEIIDDNEINIDNTTNGGTTINSLKQKIINN